MSEFQSFPKIPRLFRNVVITEKLDGTNAQIEILEDGTFLTASRNRYVTPDDDNYGFSKWAYENKEDLMTLGVGRHFGEWWGKGIARNYFQPTKKFSLFNTARWSESRPKCCEVVPILYNGVFDTWVIEKIKRSLLKNGSIAAPGFMNPEGIIMYHEASKVMFKVLLENDELPKCDIKPH